jgi:hypothetical protein
MHSQTPPVVALETLPMTINAEACLSITLTVFAKHLPQADLEFLQEAMELYGDLRVIEEEFRVIESTIFEEQHKCT